MVCPTCFCTTTEDTTDLLNGAATRSQRWASCFEVDFSYLHGGSVRSSGASRYRQWITHKFSTWHDQFGSSGCVGCGRCIAWCPVAIDITAEAAAILQVRYFVIHPGPEHSLQSPCEERFRRMENAASSLNVVAQRCLGLGIGCVLENKLPHLLFGGTSDILWILGAMSAINVGTCLDTGHAYLSGDLYNVMHKLSGHLQMIHANDNGGQYDDHRPPGEGNIDWTRLLTELSQIEFHGGFILELSGAKEPEVVLAEARRARRQSLSRVTQMLHPFWTRLQGSGLHRLLMRARLAGRSG
jgi:ferredoxin